MSSFTEPLTITQVGHKLWRCDREFTYYVGAEGSDEKIIVPNGFVCDGSSIPEFAWPIVGHPLLGGNAQAGFLHDYLYRFTIYNRKRCDEIFLEAHIVLKTALWKRNFMWFAVRTFGWLAWKEKREKKALPVSKVRQFKI